MMHEKPYQRFQHKMFNVYLLSTLINLPSLAPLLVVYYLQSCRGHLLSDILPICIKVDGHWTHRVWPSPIYQIGLCLLQFATTLEYASAISLNVGLMFTIIFGYQQMAREME